ncbi:unnamed protein product [Menidia menidia]|uniref:(Atlantic silverside) hypothetical protein n=1 Tax=Menidia menidia TaxID=238744 RepID=A0A8S4AUL8_9TELE|nr:unnamed protein product [Menidia menidia]
MAEDGGSVSSGVPDARGSEGRSSLPRTFIRLNDLSGLGAGGGEPAVVMEPASPAPDGVSTGGDEASATGGESLPYPTLAPVVFFYLKQTTRPRSWSFDGSREVEYVFVPLRLIEAALLLRRIIDS